MQQVTELLLRSGATIAELNAVRKHLSRFSGGQLARTAAPAGVVSVIVSDVVGTLWMSSPRVPQHPMLRRLRTAWTSLPATSWHRPCRLLS